VILSLRRNNIEEVKDLLLVQDPDLSLAVVAKYRQNHIRRNSWPVLNLEDLFLLNFAILHKNCTILMLIPVNPSSAKFLTEVVHSATPLLQEALLY